MGTAVVLNCISSFHDAAQTHQASLPSVNPYKMSEVDFGRQLQHTTKLASYGKVSNAQTPPQSLPRSSGPRSKLKVTAHKGVLFGAPKKSRAWRTPGNACESYSAEERLSSAACSRSRSPRGTRSESV